MLFNLFMMTEQPNIGIRRRSLGNMFELICMSVLGIAYVDACIQEHREEELRKQQEKLRDLKIKVFCYAVRHKMLYNDVVKLIEEKKLTFDEIDKDAKENG